MNKAQHIWSGKHIFYYTLFVFALVLILLAPRSAVNVDEQLHYPHAKKVVNWYFSGGQDQSCLDTPHTNLKYYGQSVDNLTALINRIFHVKEEYLTRHYTGAFFFWLLLLVSGLLTYRITMSWRAAVICVLSLVFMPRLSGQAFGNLKDIPFAVGYISGLAGMILFLQELPRPRWRTTVWLGLAIAFTISVRAGGYVLLAYFGPGLLVYLGFFFAERKKLIASGKQSARLVMQVIVVGLIAWFGGILFWPFALQNIFIHPLESLGMMEHYQVSIRQIFEGRMLWSTEMPWHYLPRWIIISTPLIVLTGMLLFLLFFFQRLAGKSRTSLLFLKAVILFAIAFPVFYVIAIGSNLYSGVRQMLFIFPPMALLSASAIDEMIRKAEKKHKITANLLLVALLLLLALPLPHQIKTFPADYIYFNVLTGGNKNAWSRYEYDYYFHGVKKPVEELIELAGSEKITVAMNSNLSHYFDRHPNITWQYTRFQERSSANWDYAVFGINYLHPAVLKNNRWKPEGIIKTYYHKGNPVAVLLKRKDKNDFYGISEIKNGNLQKGIQLLEQTIRQDTNNVWLYVHLAGAKLDTGDAEGFQRVLDEGKKIQSGYEPLLLLEASRYFEEKNYTASQNKLETLLKINSRYLPARKLLDEVKKKMPQNSTKQKRKKK